jgi:hypothetical protein
VANNYLEYSVEIPFIKGKEEECREWWYSVHDPDLPPPDDYERFINAYGEEDEFSDSMEITDSTVYMYAEESGNVESCADLIANYMKHFDINGYFRLEFATTCSRPRPGEFGGGVCCITKDEEYWMNTGSWLPPELKETEYAPS